MHVDTTGHQVMTRIGFAEGWLVRAKRQCVEGDVTRGLLTLVLAEAEMHYAREAGGAPAQSDPRRRMTSTVFAVSALTAAVVVAVSWFPSAPPVASMASTPPVVRFTAPIGTLLDLVQVPPAAKAASVAAVVPTLHPGPPRPSRQAEPRPSSTAVPTGGSPAPIAAVQPVIVQVVHVPSRPLISEVELIDLAITAERTLRSTPTTP